MGYAVQVEPIFPKTKQIGYRPDIVATDPRTQQRLLIELKTRFSSLSRTVVNRMVDLCRELGDFYRPVIVVKEVPKKSDLEYAQKHGVSIWGITYLQKYLKPELKPHRAGPFIFRLGTFFVLFIAFLVALVVVQWLFQSNLLSLFVVIGFGLSLVSSGFLEYVKLYGSADEKFGIEIKK